MAKGSLGPVWNVALALVAVAALGMALYVQFLAPGRGEEPPAAAQQEARDESRLRAEIEKDAAAEPPADQPLPNAVIRRGESGRSLQQVLNDQESQEAALARLRENLNQLAGQMEDSNQALRREVTELRADLRRERETSRRTLSLLLVALIPLVIQLLASLRGRD